MKGPYAIARRGGCLAHVVGAAMKYACGGNASASTDISRGYTPHRKTLKLSWSRKARKNRTFQLLSERTVTAQKGRTKENGSGPTV